jgi:hypothetical protein
MMGPTVNIAESARISALEQRVAALEAEARNLGLRAGEAAKKLDTHGDRIGQASERITELKERVAHLPGKAMVFTTALAIVAAIGAIFTFQSKIQAWLGLGAVPPH